MTAVSTIQTKLVRLTELADIAAEKHGLLILEVKWGQQGKRPSLEVCIFKKGDAIGLDDCEKVSRELEAQLDATPDREAIFNGAFLLEVVSPGIDRQLTTPRDFEAFTGEQVLVKAKEKLGTFGIELIGILIDANEHTITLNNVRQHVVPSKATARKSGVKPAAENSSPEDLHTFERAKIFKINLYSDDL